MYLVISRLCCTRPFGCAVELPRVGTQTGTQIGTQRFGFGGANRANSLGTPNGAASRQLRPIQREFRTGEQQSVGRPDRGATFQIYFSFPLCVGRDTSPCAWKINADIRVVQDCERRFYVWFFRRFMAGLFNRDQAFGSEPDLRKLWLSSSILDTTRDVGPGAAKRVCRSRDSALMAMKSLSTWRDSSSIPRSLRSSDLVVSGPPPLGCRTASSGQMSLPAMRCAIAGGRQSLGRCYGVYHCRTLHRNERHCVRGRLPGRLHSSEKGHAVPR